MQNQCTQLLHAVAQHRPIKPELWGSRSRQIGHSQRGGEAQCSWQRAWKATSGGLGLFGNKNVQDWDMEMEGSKQKKRPPLFIILF